MPPETHMPLPGGSHATVWRDAAHTQPDNLRAWDAADELALDHLAADPEVQPLLGGSGEGRPRWLVVGDTFGALQVGIASTFGVDVWGWTDSVVAQAAAVHNLLAAGLPGDRQVDGDQPPPPADRVLVRIPRTGSLLVDELTQVVRALGPGTPVIGVGMTRHIHTSTVQAFEQIVGPTTTTLARRKARLVLASVGETPSPREGVSPTGGVSPEGVVAHAVDGVEVVAGPGVFSRDRIDAGTALLLEALDERVLSPGRRIDVIDLGCGSGVVGTVVATRAPSANVTFTDESFRAVGSARQTFARAHGDRPATFHVADGLAACADASADLVVVNPPFHRGHEVGDATAWAMFADARRVLRPGGRLVAVGNRHLGHHARLKRLYGGMRVLASNPSYVVMSATRR